MDITLRSCTNEVIQYFRLRSGCDKHCGGETTRINLRSDGVDAVEFGTVMVRNFIVEIIEERLMCPEIQKVGKVSSADLECMHRGLKLVQFEKANVYSSGRYVIRDEGKVSKEEMGKNFEKASTRYIVNQGFFSNGARVHCMDICRATLKRLKNAFENLRRSLATRRRNGNSAANKYESRSEVRIRYPISSRQWPSHLFRSFYTDMQIVANFKKN